MKNGIGTQNKISTLMSYKHWEKKVFKTSSLTKKNNWRFVLSLSQNLINKCGFFSQTFEKTRAYLYEKKSSLLFFTRFGFPFSFSKFSKFFFAFSFNFENEKQIQTKKTEIPKITISSENNFCLYNKKHFRLSFWDYILLSFQNVSIIDLLFPNSFLHYNNTSIQ